ncbi:Lrp/AsnC ligand binding domain-containing protein [Roseovarius sp. MBR-6]|jgi:DNA-binding Lrp family transcriptional regulator|uniref:M20/M25/M40 family metallo-hydrolase n=1 Tax=Roseovarius sp. MBR-6 TaxID=3156459 RepID=UPI0033987607
MEAAAVISTNVAGVNPVTVDHGITVFVEIEMESERAGQIEAAKRLFATVPEVQQCHHVTGNTDFILLVVVRTMADYATLTRRLFFGNNTVKRFRSSLSMTGLDQLEPEMTLWRHVLHASRCLHVRRGQFRDRAAGHGGHAARPDQSRETLVAAGDMVMALQTLVARRLDPTDAATVSVTDGTRNALPGMARILGDARSFVPEVSAMIESHLRRIARSTAAPAMGSEDFARFLDHVPGCFVFLGNGAASKPRHNPGYDFDDRGLIHGARFHAAMARHRLPPA